MKEREKQLTKTIEEQAALIEKQALIIEEQAKRICQLEEKVDTLVHRIFGKKSEQLQPGQLDFWLSQQDAPGKDQEADAGDKAAASDLELKAPKKTRKVRKQRIPDDLPTEEIVIDPPEVLAEPDAYRHLGDEVSDQLDYRPGKFLRRRIIRRKYICKDREDSPILIADLPPKLQDACLATPGLITECLTNKYCYHFPYYRQQHMFRQRFGIDISRQNMTNWESLACDWLKPIYQIYRRLLLKSTALQADETVIKYIEPGTGAAQQGYLWTYRDLQTSVCLFDWHNTRAHTCIEAVLQPDAEARRQGLGPFQGLLQCDGYDAYGKYSRKHQGIELAACWAHARRKFVEAQRTKSGKQIDSKRLRQIAWILRQISLLYRIESELREMKASPVIREAVRSHQSRPIYERIGKILQRLSPQSLPKSNLGIAISYTLKLWPRLGMFIDHGILEIDNNLTENEIRTSAVGKKNWLFFGSPDSGWKAALLYTLIGNCKRLGIDPNAYLKDVLERLPSLTNHQVETMLPENWLAAHSTRAA